MAEGLRERRENMTVTFADTLLQSGTSEKPTARKNFVTSHLALDVLKAR